MLVRQHSGCYRTGTHMILMLIIWIIGPLMAENIQFRFKNHQYYSVVQILGVFQLIDCTNMVQIDAAGLADYRRGHIDIPSYFNWRYVTFLVFYSTTRTNWMFQCRYQDSTEILDWNGQVSVSIWTIFIFEKKEEKKEKKILILFYPFYMMFFELRLIRRAISRAFEMGSHCWSMFFLLSLSIPSFFWNILTCGQHALRGGVK